MLVCSRHQEPGPVLTLVLGPVDWTAGRLLVTTLPPRPPRSDCWPGAGSQAALPPLPALQMVSVAVTTYQVTIVTHDTDSNGQNMVRMATLAAPLLRGDLHLVNINNLDTMLPAETATSAARSTRKIG